MMTAMTGEYPPVVQTPDTTNTLIFSAVDDVHPTPRQQRCTTTPSPMLMMATSTIPATTHSCQ